MRPQRVGSVDAFAPKSNVMCGKPLLMAIGMGGSTGFGTWLVENVFTSCTINLTFFNSGGGRERDGGGGGLLRRREGLTGGGPGGRSGAGVVANDWVTGAGGAGKMSDGRGSRFRRCGLCANKFL